MLSNEFLVEDDVCILHCVSFWDWFLSDGRYVHTHTVHTQRGGGVEEVAQCVRDGEVVGMNPNLCGGVGASHLGPQYLAP